MKRRVVHLISILLVLAVVAGGVRLFARAMRNTESEAKYADFLAHSDDVDVYFFGSSHMHYGVDPMQLWDDYGITSYNYGNGGLPLPLSYWSFRMAVERHQPKVAVLDVFGLSKPDSDEMPVGLTHDAWDCFPLDRVKLEAIREVFPERSDRLELMFPFSVYHNRWDEVTLNDLLGEKEIRYNLLRGGERIHDVIPSQKMPQVADTEAYDIGHPTKALQYVERFISDCKELGIIPVLVYIPFEAQPERQMEANTIEQLAASENILYLNMLHQNVLDLETDSADMNSHVNVSGMTKITAFLGKILAESGAAPDHRGDSAYARWDADYAVYREQEILERLKNTRSFDELLVQLYDDSLGAYIQLFKGCGFDEREQQLLAQIPNMFGIEPDVEPEAGAPDADLRIIVYDMITGKEADIQYYNIRGVRVGEYNEPLYPE